MRKDLILTNQSCMQIHCRFAVCSDTPTPKVLRNLACSSALLQVMSDYYMVIPISLAAAAVFSHYYPSKATGEAQGPCESQLL